MYDNAREVIAVIGATGRQGGAAVQALLAAGRTVRGLTRNVDSDAARALAAAGVEVVATDLDDPSSLRAAFEGVSGVFAMTTPGEDYGPEGEVRHGRNIADAASAAGVRHLVFSSVGGAERSTGIPHFESKFEVEQYIDSLGIPATIVRPVFFMENLLWSTRVENGEITISFPLSDDIPMQMIAAADIGRVAAAVVLDDAWIGRSLEIGGDTKTGPEMAAAFGRYAGLPASYHALPIDAVGGTHDSHAMFRWFAGPDGYDADFDTTRALDPAVLDLEAWLPTTSWTAER